MAGFRVEGNTSGNVAEVDATNNLKVTLPQELGESGYNRPMSEVDAGGVMGTPTLLAGEVSEDYAMRISQNSILGRETFNHTSQNTGQSTVVTATMTLGYSGQLSTNASGIVTASTGVLYQSKQYFPMFAPSETYLYLKVRWSGTWAVTNTTMGAGMSINGLTVPHTPTDGVGIRANNTGLFGWSVVNSTEQSTQPFKVAFGGAGFSPTLGTAYDIIISSSSRSVVFWMDFQDGEGFQRVGVISLSAAQRRPMYSGSAPFSVYHVIGGTNASAVQGMQIVEWCITNDGLANTRDPVTSSAIMYGAGQGLSGHTMGSLALYTNSLAAGAGAVMTNTTAALGSGLGGQFSALPTLAAGTDGIVSSYQNPLGTIAITGQTLIIEGFRIEAAVTTVLAGNSTPVLFALSFSYGGTAVSLATAEAANAKAPRRIPLGYQSFAAAAAVGTTAQVIDVNFPPVPVYPGEFAQIVAKNLGVVTTTGVVTFLITPKTRWVI